MSINKFIETLTNELYKNLFYDIVINKIYNKYDGTYLIHIIAKRNGVNYDYNYGYSINEKWLNNQCINDIVNCLLNM